MDPMTGIQPSRKRQGVGGMPSWRYRAARDRSRVALGDRRWPAQTIESAPLWCPVDLRDGNQALPNPMDTERKQRLFDLMVEIGYKEIEVGYASASQVDFDFVRKLIDEDRIPEDVTIAVLTPAREDLIDRTFEALDGASRAIVHLYVATAPLWRSTVLGVDRQGLRDLVASAAIHLLRGVEQRPKSDLRLQYSPETFNLTEPELALEICNMVTDLWQPTPDWPVILNLPSTVESSTPNVFADQVEWIHRNLERRSSVLLSVHPHNDRGTGVASAELALMAGAQRVEGCLFGNGERTGNVCLITLGLNLHSHGIDPRVDLSDIDHLRSVVEYANQLPVSGRHPYAGDFVYTAFSGTHQDAINKVLAARERYARHTGVPLEEQPWEVPYLPIDPHDVGRTYEAVIRVNSQSGKGGVAYLLKRDQGLELPRRLQQEFAAAVQAKTELSGEELSAADLWATFRVEYGLEPQAPPERFALKSYESTSLPNGRESLSVEISTDDATVQWQATGTGPIDAFVAALRAARVDISVLDYAEHALGEGGDALAAAYVECRVAGRVLWGVSVDPNIVRASLGAVLSAVNRAARSQSSTDPTSP